MRLSSPIVGPFGFANWPGPDQNELHVVISGPGLVNLLTLLPSLSAIEATMCTLQEGQEMIELSTSTMVGRSMRIDVAWGRTSQFAITITQYRNNKVEIFYAESFEQTQMNQITDHIVQLKQSHHITKDYCDGANPEVIREYGQRISYVHPYRTYPMN